MNHCLKCSKETNNPKFCSRSCSVTFNNAIRIRTQEYKENLSKLFKHHPAYQKQCVYPPKPKICVVCSKYHIHVQGKTCSDDCYKTLRSNQQSEILKTRVTRTNYGRGKKSYLERSFENWANSYNLKFESEIPFKNDLLNKTYFADFVFNDYKLIIELDGTQHRNTVEQDAIRDLYILSNYNYYVLRISHSEYIHKTKLPILKLIFNLASETGLEPA